MKDKIHWYYTGPNTLCGLHRDQVSITSDSDCVTCLDCLMAEIHAYNNEISKLESQLRSKRHFINYLTERIDSLKDSNA